MAAKHAPSEKARTPSNGPSARTYLSSSKRAFCADSGECGSKYEKYSPSGWESEAISNQARLSVPEFRRWGQIQTLLTGSHRPGYGALDKFVSMVVPKFIPK
jgi:hypothetical protein